LHGNPLCLGKIFQAVRAVAGLQPQQPAQAMKLAGGPAFAGLDLAGDIRQCRKPFRRTMRLDAVKANVR
jgi:hypothetical protein